MTFFVSKCEKNGIFLACAFKNPPNFAQNSNIRNFAVHVSWGHISLGNTLFMWPTQARQKNLGAKCWLQVWLARAFHKLTKPKSTFAAPKILCKQWLHTLTRHISLRDSLFMWSMQARKIICRQNVDLGWDSLHFTLANQT